MTRSEDRNIGIELLLTAELASDALKLLHGSVNVSEGGELTHGRLIEPRELSQELRGKDALIVGYEQVTEDVMDECPDLKLIASIRGGPEANVSIDAATKRGIPVLYTLGRTQHAVAEYTFALMLAVARNVSTGDQMVKSRILTDDTPQAYGRDVVWRLPEGTEEHRLRASLIGTELYSKTLGLIGLGNIGREVARLGQAFGMHVIAYDPYLRAEHASVAGVEFVDLHELMRTSDFVSLHARVSPESVGVVGRGELRLMKPTAYLVNTSRAALLDEEALVEALQEQWIAGAGLDVFHKEPLDPNSPLLELNQVVLTPHLAGSSREIPSHHSQMVVDDVLSYLGGHVPLERLKNPDVLDVPAFVSRGKLVLG